MTTLSRTDVVVALGEVEPELVHGHLPANATFIESPTAEDLQRATGAIARADARVDVDLFDRMPLLQVVARTGVGVDIVDVAEATRRDIAVVVNKSNAAKSMTLAELVKLAKGGTKKWADAKDVTVVMRDPAAPEMKTVIQKVFGMTPDEVKTLITTLNGARKDSFVIANSDDVLVKTVQITPGAMGFVDVYSINSGVNVVNVDGKSPLEPGYALHGQ